jgi:flagellar biosynthesis/type III secretory pathway ATPase
VAVAEWFRDLGLHVLLLVDSITRAVRARRDIEAIRNTSLSAGAFPASVFSLLPALMERTGTGESGAITAVFTVLTEPDADPLAAEMRSLLDGHWELSDRLATRGIWPAIDPLRSVSRAMTKIATPTHLAAAGTLRRTLAAFADNEELVLMGAYRQGASRDTDAYLRNESRINEFFAAGDAPSAMTDTLRMLQDLHQRLS